MNYIKNKIKDWWNKPRSNIFIQAGGRMQTDPFVLNSMIVVGGICIFFLYPFFIYKIITYSFMLGLVFLYMYYIILRQLYKFYKSYKILGFEGMLNNLNLKELYEVFTNNGKIKRKNVNGWIKKDATGQQRENSKSYRKFQY